MRGTSKQPMFVVGGVSDMNRQVKRLLEEQGHLGFSTLEVVGTCPVALKGRDALQSMGGLHLCRGET